MTTGQLVSDDERCQGPEEETCSGCAATAAWPPAACARHSSPEQSSPRLNAQARFHAAYARALDRAAAERVAWRR